MPEPLTTAEPVVIARLRERAERLGLVVEVEGVDHPADYFTDGTVMIAAFTHWHVRIRMPARAPGTMLAIIEGSSKIYADFVTTKRTRFGEATWEGFNRPARKLRTSQDLDIALTVMATTLGPQTSG